MKNFILNLFLGVLLLTACNRVSKVGAENTGNDTSSYKMVSFYKTSTECKQDTCGAIVKASYPDFESPELQKFVNQIITNDIANRGNLKLETLADSFINDFMKFKKDYPESVAGYQWIQTLKVDDNRSKLITFTHDNYSFTGGAHGLGTISYFNYSKEQNRALKLDDLIKQGQYNNLVKVGEEIFRKDEKLSPEQSLEENYFFENGQFGLPNNFLITDKGLLFTYNPYEIKAYAYGTTDLLIPYDRMKEIINPGSVLATYVK
ncbi:hypothetical protein Pedsa_0918 [Pseudopedobacter saltans DSM 12145]|uniref:DUF3298/DUF4163 domain-containing protein n=1 Tax=Pseudopedobacter saltans (strain ATCC 51119 / DSM 12145 / JCM 21818 / CCUG 39354 / LMG 10337 / NBRC 100064 / NCIMB 13643) TaxID=762903 RepID=F0SAB3_PSESL|nr:DUF3298 and DUF4163 domain-containing protein [Pseudopedobacter saltans]ADY51490.1 hypothetical protein Pedsa_0918 [Pseudopedobacter saltans DSM 12145]